MQLVEQALAAVVTGARRYTSVATRTPARLLVFNAPAVRALLSRAPRVRRKSRGPRSGSRRRPISGEELSALPPRA
jgi:hypothetical protein